MADTREIESNMPEDLAPCVAFHGHLCPGLVYGYLVSKEALRLLNLDRSQDEEIVAVCENDSCSIDGIQVMLGTTMGKGNLIIKDYGKNAYTVFSRSSGKAFRFSRKTGYVYTGEFPDNFQQLEAGFTAGTLSARERRKQKLMKAADLVSKPFDEVFITEEEPFAEPPYAPLAPSRACDICGEMTMETKLVKSSNDQMKCIPCSNL